MPEIDTSTSLAALVSERPARARLFEQLRFDYCCGGAQTLAEACAQRGLDAGTVRELLEALDQMPTDDAEPLEDLDWRRASIADLCDHIVSVHHAGLRHDLPCTAELLQTVIRVHGGQHPELHDLGRMFTRMREELEQHMGIEERVLFPACRALEAGQAPDSKLDELLARHEHDHADTGDALAALRELTDDYDAAGAFCGTHRSLLGALRRLELDLHQHIHEENNVLFPRVRALTQREPMR